MGKNKENELPEWRSVFYLMKKWKKNLLDIGEYICNYGLPFYLFWDLSQPEDSQVFMLSFLRNDHYRFNSKDFKKFEKEHPELLAVEATRSAEQEKAIFPCKPGTKWEDIIMTLGANDMVKIKTPQGEGRFTYHELGMSDKRAGDKPTMLWELLKLFAKNQGFISSQNPNYDPKLPDTAKRLNKHLKGRFRINETIYIGHYKKEKGYKTKIKFYDHTL